MIKHTLLYLLVLWSFLSYAKTQFTIDINRKAGVNHYFWQAAGHDFMFYMIENESGKYLLSRIKQYASIKYIRCHSMFLNDSVRGGNVVKFNADGSYRFDFSRVNLTYRNYINNGIKPIVEFDFFPKGFARSFGGDVNSEGFPGKNAEPRDWNEWERLLRAAMENFIAVFGKEELRTWYFEVWNEPDHWPTEHLDVFFRLYDVFAHVVKSYDPGFRVGGPATFNIYALKSFLDHVVKGTNFVTGKKSSPIDFISHHIYGLSGGWLKTAPEIVPQVSKFSAEILWIKRLLDDYQGLGNVEFHINEWGVCSNFERTQAQFPQLEYRNNEFSPLFMTKLVDCLWAIEDNYNFKTSMLLYWGFSWEDMKNQMFVGNRELTTGGNTPKPIQVGFDLLSMLQKDRLKVEGNRPGERLGILPTIGNGKLAFVVYNFNETDDNLSIRDELSLLFSGLPAGTKLRGKVYMLDRNHNNSYEKWKKIGSPADLSLLPANWSDRVSRLEWTDKMLQVDARGNTDLKLKLPRHSLQLFLFDL